MSVTLFLLNKKGFDVLKCFISKPAWLKAIDAVVASKDKGNNEDYFEEIQILCREHQITFKDRNEFYDNKSDFSLAVGWRWLIKDVSKLIVIHDSFLPFYRGFSPVVNMLIKGENYLAASAIWANEGMDEGDIIAQKKISIQYPMKVQDAINIVSDLYTDIVTEILTKIENGKELEGKPQFHSQATYSIWRDEEDYFINWEQSAEEIRRFVDAVGFPYGGARTNLEGQVIGIISCEEKRNITSEISMPGKILKFEEGFPIVLCGKNALKITNMKDDNGNSFHLNKLRIRFK